MLTFVGRDNLSMDNYIKKNIAQYECKLILKLIFKPPSLQTVLYMYTYTNISIYFIRTICRLYIKPALKCSHALVTPRIVSLLRYPRVAHEFSSP